MTATQALREVLAAPVPMLSENDRDFAASLLRSVEGRRSPPSEKQVYWINKLVERATSPAPERKEEHVGDLSGIIALFDKAKSSKLKYPAIVLYVEKIGDIKISIAGERAKVPGSLNVATNEGYGSSTWYGRVKRDGMFEHSLKQEAPPVLTEALREFAASPAEVAARHGKLTGCCCFCNRKLTDEKSVERGYGPVCAKAWGV